LSIFQPKPLSKVVRQLAGVESMEISNVSGFESKIKNESDFLNRSGSGNNRSRKSDYGNVRRSNVANDFVGSASVTESG